MQGIIFLIIAALVFGILFGLQAFLNIMKKRQGVYKTELFVVFEVDSKLLKFNYMCELTPSAKRKFGPKISIHSKGDTIEEAYHNALLDLKEQIESYEI